MWGSIGSMQSISKLICSSVRNTDYLEQNQTTKQPYNHTTIQPKQQKTSIAYLLNRVFIPAYLQHGTIVSGKLLYYNDIKICNFKELV